MKTYILLICFVASAMSQRPSFAGGPKGVPDLHPRFKGNETNTNQNSGSGAATELGNRFGETNGSNGNLPIDARGDVDLVNRLKNWPKKNQPFWLVNHQIIEEYRGRPGGSTGGQNVSNQGFTGQQGTAQTNTGTDPLLVDRFGGDSNQNQPGIGSDNSFSIVMSGQWRTYVYQPATDSWVRRN